MAGMNSLSTDDGKAAMLFVLMGAMFTTLGVTVGDDFGSVATYGFLLAGISFAFAGLLRAR